MAKQAATAPSVKVMKEQLTRKGVKFSSKATKAQLEKLLKGTKEAAPVAKVGPRQGGEY